MGKRIRPLENYPDYYQKMLELGKEFQDFVSEFLYSRGLFTFAYTSRAYQEGKGENISGIEIKLDQRYSKTGNLYIETAEKSHPGNTEYVPSGINSDKDIWLYIIGDYNQIFVFSITTLRILSEKFDHKITPTSKGFLLPLRKARKYAAIVFDTGNKE